MGLPQYLPQVFVFADESEYKVPWKKEEARRINYVYAVGAVVVEDKDSLADLNAKLKELREEVINDRSITNHEERFRLEQSGWHLTEDQLSTAFPLWRFMGQSVGIKYHYRYVETLEKVDGSKLGRVYAVLHAALAKDLVRRYAEDYLVEFNFEEYTDLNSRFERLIQFCIEQSDGWDIQEPQVNIVKKGQSDLSSIADYMILGISRLIGQNEIACAAVADCGGQCRATLFSSAGPALGHVISKNSEFRNFEYIRASISSVSKVRLHTGVLS